MASGYGAATIAWLQANNQIASEWDSAGTIMDFVACFLTKLRFQHSTVDKNFHFYRSPKVVMSTQNAEVCFRLNGTVVVL